MAVVDWDADVIVEPSERQEAFRMVRAEIEESPWLLEVGFRVGFEGTDDVRELHSVTYEEHGEIVADYIEVAFTCVEFDGESTWVTESFRAAALVDDGGETDDDGGLDTRSAEEVGAG